MEALEALETVEKAQLLAGHPTSTKQYRHCSPFILPSGGVVVLSPTSTITLAADAVYTPQCTSLDQTGAEGDIGGGVAISSMRDPFHASITPQAYATGAATVIAWMLVIMLIITPRTFFVGGASGRSGLMGRRGMISGATGGGSVIGVGTRPWLQKAAALTVAVSLTLATADTFKIAGRQYAEGYMDAIKLRDLVVSALEIKVSRVISDVFLWLAQVQTLIRLFPRHKEKVIIKWVGFALILFDITFSSLNSFGPYNATRSPRHFETAIPALSYLFQLSLSMLYAAWVMYYAITKRRYAFYHSMMWNIAIVALLSIIAILTPVVFFITDISNHTIAGWGDYFRWVGAAAASVIVWEWVERIEALEREERKDGILGREIYDGDEMLDTTPSHDLWPRTHRKGVSDDEEKPGNGGRSRGLRGFASGTGSGLSSLTHRVGKLRRPGRNSPQPEKRERTIRIEAPRRAYHRNEPTQRAPGNSGAGVPHQNVRQPVRTISSPVSRTDTTSADSTVYTIRYHPVSVSPALGNDGVTSEHQPGRAREGGTRSGQDTPFDSDPEKAIEEPQNIDASQSTSWWPWHASNPFRRKGRSPPPEVHRGRVIEPLGVEDAPSNIPPRTYNGLALKDRLGTFAAHQGERFRSKINTGQQADANLPVTIIPAQPRGRTWSPQQETLGQEISAPLSQASATTGLHPIDDLGHHGLSRREEANTPLNGPKNVSQPGTGAGIASSATLARRASHVRFATTTPERSATQPDVGQDRGMLAPFPMLSTLGREVRDHEVGADTEASDPQSTVRDASTDEHDLPTNHSR